MPTLKEEKVKKISTTWATLGMFKWEIEFSTINPSKRQNKYINKDWEKSVWPLEESLVCSRTFLITSLSWTRRKKHTSKKIKTPKSKERIVFYLKKSPISWLLKYYEIFFCFHWQKINYFRLSYLHLLIFFFLNL